MDRTAKSKVTDEYGQKGGGVICAAAQKPLDNLTGCAPLAFGAAVSEEDFRRIQNRMVLDCCKWDAQVGDVCTLFRQPLLMRQETWQELARAAEGLTTELLSAEQELLERADLHAELGLPKRLRPTFAQARRLKPTPCAVRTLRFDFHYTTEGWRISEVNSDVPGGYSEASCFTVQMSEFFPHARPAGNPANAWADGMISVAGTGGHVALLSAPGFLEDQQVTAFLAGQLQKRGVEAFLLHHPAQLKWKSGLASIASNQRQIGIDAIVRFYQGEWLAALSASCEWKRLFAGGETPVANPGIALLSESKRLPLAWDRISSKMTTWRKLLPECRNPIDPSWQAGDEWALKAAFSNTGDAVHMREFTDHNAWTSLCRSVKKHPERWIAQRRFKPLPIVSDAGAVYPCVGVYTINGRACGAYVRVGLRQVIDYAAMDVALLIEEEKC